MRELSSTPAARTAAEPSSSVVVPPTAAGEEGTVLTPEAAAALKALQARKAPPRLAAKNWSEHGEDGWTVTLVRADGKRTWITRPTLAEALVRAHELAQLMSADARAILRG